MIKLPTAVFEAEDESGAAAAPEAAPEAAGKAAEAETSNDGGQEPAKAAKAAEPAPKPEAKGKEKQAAPEGGDAPDWRSGIEDKDLRDLAGRYTTPQDMAKALKDFRAANASMIKVPGKDASEEDMAKFFKAIGRPDDETGYGFLNPAEGEELSEQDQAFRQVMAKAMFESGVPGQAAEKLVEKWNEFTETVRAEEERVAKKEAEAAEAELRKEFGTDFDAARNVAQRAAEVFGGKELADLLNSTIVNGRALGDHPALFRALSKVGYRMGEGGFIGAVTEQDRESVREEIDTLMRDNPPGSDKYKNPAVQKRLRELNEKLYGTTGVTESRAV